MVNKNSKVTKKQIAREFRAETVKTFTSLFTSAFALVAALAWNEAVKDAIERYITPGQGLKSKLIYAIFVTLLAVLISYEMGKIAARFKIDDESEGE